MSGIRRTAQDIKFSKMIRERDDWTCQRCGSVHLPNSRGLHCAHCFTRRCGACTSKSPKPHTCTRHDPDNALALDYGCHQFVDSHPDEKERLFREKLGDEAYDELAARAHGRRERVSS